MARNHGQILCSIWSDRDFTGLTVEEQRMYFVLLSQRLLNHAGVVPMTLQKWANLSPDTTADDVLRWLEGLARKRYVVFDPATEELLVRSLIRNDGVAKQPQVLKAALRVALEVDSPLIRWALAEELRKLDSEQASRTADALCPKGSPTPPEPFGQPLVDTLPEGFAKGGRDSRGKGEGETSVVRSSHVGGSVSPTILFAVPEPEPVPKPASYPQVFEDAWLAYGRKGAKKTAFAEWRRATRRATVAVIVAAIPAYVDSTPDPKFRKDFERWLKGDCWESAVVPRRKAAGDWSGPYQDPPDDSVYDEEFR